MNRSRSSRTRIRNSIWSKRHHWNHFLRVIRQHGSGEKHRKKQRSRLHHKTSFEQLTLLCPSIAFASLRPNLLSPEFPELLDCPWSVAAARNQRRTVESARVFKSSNAASTLRAENPCHCLQSRREILVGSSTH